MIRSWWSVSFSAWFVSFAWSYSCSWMSFELTLERHIIISWTWSAFFHFSSWDYKCTPNNHRWSSVQRLLNLVSGWSRSCCALNPLLIIPSLRLTNSRHRHSCQNSSRFGSVKIWSRWSVSYINFTFTFWKSHLSRKWQVRDYNWSFQVSSGVWNLIVSWSWVAKLFVCFARSRTDRSGSRWKTNLNTRFVSNLLHNGVVTHGSWTCICLCILW